MADLYTSHYSVLKAECLNFFKTQDKNPLFADLTFGAGGHSLEIATQYPNCNLWATDQDEDAYQNGLDLIKNKENIHLIKTNFENFPKHCDEKGLSGFNGILMDLGVSSHHFDKQERGFSFNKDAPLDMRMNQDEELTAEILINEAKEEELANLIYKYGEERFSRKIAKKICEERKKKRITTTKELEEIVFHTYPKQARYKKTHPATRTFQALRIVVNRELEVLENSIENLFNLLRHQGCLAIITFHSLEDRIVKHKYKEIFQKDKNAAKILTKKPVYPSEQEILENPRSRSAKLRVIQKIIA